MTIGQHIVAAIEDLAMYRREYEEACDRELPRAERNESLGLYNNAKRDLAELIDQHVKTSAEVLNI